MSFDEFISNLTYKDLKTINEEFYKRQNLVPTYSYSKMTMQTLKSIVDIRKKIDKKVFESWFCSDIELDSDEVIFLEKLLDKEGEYIKYYYEEDLKAKFIIPILNRVDFTIPSKNIKDFYDNRLVYENENFIFQGKADYIVSEGDEYSERPYFFIQEFKKGEEYSNPRPQLLAELISAIEINSINYIRGAYIVGAIWNFVILEKRAKNSYIYYISRDFLSSNISDLKLIYRNLLFIKNEIIETVK
jgi:hypothetical protein